MYCLFLSADICDLHSTVTSHGTHSHLPHHHVCSSSIQSIQFNATIMCVVLAFSPSSSMPVSSMSVSIYKTPQTRSVVTQVITSSSSEQTARDLNLCRTGTRGACVSAVLSRLSRSSSTTSELRLSNRRTAASIALRLPR